VKLPVGCDVRIGMHAGVSLYYVFLAPRSSSAGMHLLDEIAEPGHMSAMFTHDAGIDWPDRRSVALAKATLEQGCPVISSNSRDWRTLWQRTSASPRRWRTEPLSSLGLAPKWSRPTCYLQAPSSLSWAKGIMSEDRLAMAERHVQENERRIAKQAALVERLQSEGHAVPFWRPTKACTQ
jgi:hypothetical protein